MNRKYPICITELERSFSEQVKALRQRDLQPSLVEETEAFLRSALACAEGKIGEEERKIEYPGAQIERLRRVLFGARSEKLQREVEQAEAQLKRRGQESDRYSGCEDGPQIPRQLRQLRHRCPLPAHLPRGIYHLEPKKSCCLEHGSELDCPDEVSAEQLGLVSGALKVIRTVRMEKACTECNCIVEAPASSRPTVRNIAGSGLFARVLTGKYCEHLPLYRQGEIFVQQDAELSRALTSNWVSTYCQLIAPLDDVLYHYVTNTRKIRTDGTPVKVLTSGRKKVKTGRIRTYVRNDRNADPSEPSTVWFAYSPDRQGEHPVRHPRLFRGTLQANAFSSCDQLFGVKREGGAQTEATCRAHVRRKIRNI